MTSSASSVYNLLDLPDEILIKILLYFDARERITIGYSCQRLNNLVFGDEELLRDLDFSRKWWNTSKINILEYFENEKTYKMTKKLNIWCVTAAEDLSSIIGKAINLVTLNTLNGMQFKSVEELSRFLEPLVHLKQLSVNWPASDRQGDYDDPICNKLLEKPFGRLTYLSIQVEWFSEQFLLILQLCQQLEDLCVVISKGLVRRAPLSQVPMKLKNLKAVRFFCQDDPGPLKDFFMSMVENPAEWTDFHLVDINHEAYFERNVEVCEKLWQLKKIPLHELIPGLHNPYMSKMGSHVFSENLLSEVVRVTHEDVPEKFCCLSSYGQSCLLDIEEAKKLLKDPEYQISYLDLRHAIERNCDVHLLASAFPKLSTLCISEFSHRNSDRASEENEPFRRRLRKKDCIEPKEHDDPNNPDSSFKMFIENTPNLKLLVITSTPGKIEYWDSDALNLISGWRNLTTIRFTDIPITDGNFLINIGKQCTKLEEVVLCCLGPRASCVYESELSQMLQHCRNLKKFSIRQDNFNKLRELFNGLSKNSKLRSVTLVTYNEADDSDLLETGFGSSLEKMLQQCTELTRLTFDVSPSYIHGRLDAYVQRMANLWHMDNLVLDTSESTYHHDDDDSTAFFSSPLVPFPHRRYQLLSRYSSWE